MHQSIAVFLNLSPLYLSKEEDAELPYLFHLQHPVSAIERLWRLPIPFPFPEVESRC